MSTLTAASAQPVDRHKAAVSNSLGRAQESADCGDCADAFKWIRTLEAIGEQLPPEYQAKRLTWEGQLGASGTDRRPS